MIKKSLEHELAFIAARLCVIKSQELHSNATGFFYLAKLDPNDEKSSSVLLLISNKHVLDSGKPIILALNIKGVGSLPDYGNTVEFKFSDFSNGYFSHPSKDVDLACLNVSKLLHTNAYIRWVDEKFLTSIDYDKVALGGSVLFVGYPDSFYDEVNNLPLVRKGSLASMPNIDFGGKKQIVIDAQVFPGSSGSPVFVDWNGNYALIGVISQWAFTANSEIPKQSLGLGLIEKQQSIKELVDCAVSETIKRY